MSIYIFGSIVLSFITLLSGFFVYRRYRQSSGLFYLFFSLAFPIWFFLYMFSFDSSYSSEFILTIYRFQYSLSIIGFYSILFFVLFFGKNNTKMFSSKLAIYIFFLIIFLLSNFTGLILSDVSYSNTINSYAEVYGGLYIIFVILYIILFPLFLGISIFKLKTLSNLNKVRISYIIGGFTLFLGFSLTFHVFIPFFSADSSQLYLEDIFPFFIIPFVVGVVFSSSKYDFSGYKVYLNNIFSYIISFSFTTLWIYIYHGIIKLSDNNIQGFWKVKENLTWVDLFFSLILFAIFLNIFKKYHIHNNVRDMLLKIQEQIPFITNTSRLNIFLEQQFKQLFFIQSTRIDTKIDNKKELVNFFKKNRNIPYIINDFVFLEKNKHKLNIKSFYDLVSANVNIIFPIYESREDIRAFLFLGKKRFSDAYTTQEVKAFLDFSLFLQGHLKYLGVYNKLQEMTVSLDKRVDEKTIEYNTLLSKQKEFIAYVGHEIKNPITNSIFLCDSLNEEIGKGSSAKISKSLKEDASILCGELLKVSELVKQIFSTQQFDLDKVKLYKKSVDIGDFLHSELHIFENSHPGIYFELDMEDVGKRKIDETQFRQVIHNILTNAVKFADKNRPKIYVSVQENIDKKVVICIEDNGPGFHEIDIEHIFDKYSTGAGSSVGLGMGLYLCKKIVELHKGSISVRNGKKLKGASFSITL